MIMNLYGMHDTGSEYLIVDAGRTGYTVHTEAVGNDPGDQSGKSYNTFGDKICNIVRLNNGYGSTGTIPLPQFYKDFANRCANFVKASSGCTRYIIGNEIALQWEWPDSQVITLASYIECFNLVRSAIKAVSPNTMIMCQPPAPWNPSTPDSPDWVDQLSTMFTKVDGVDGIAIHTYTHGHDPALITSEACMNPPYDKRHFHFRAYQDFMQAIPHQYRNLPVYITESNPDGWQDVNNGWIQSAYAEINDWNVNNDQQIHCLCLYRWPSEDREQFWINTKPGVIEDYKQAVAVGYSPREVSTIGVPLEAVTTIYVTAEDGLYFRDAPNKQGNIIETLPNGTALTMIRQVGLYVEAQKGSQRGFVALDYITVEPPTEKSGPFKISRPCQRQWPVTQGFGENPEVYAQFGYNGHQGIDFGTPIGSPIYAVDDGDVELEDFDRAGFGHFIKIQHAWGNSTYAHLSDPHVRVGESVIRDQVIGSSGNTGMSTGPHLHFHLRIHPWDDHNGYGGSIDPMPYLDD